MCHLDVPVIGSNVFNNGAPELRRFEHIGLVDRHDLLAPLAREIECHARDAFDFGS